MKRILQLISWLSLVGILGASCVFYSQGLELAQTQRWIVIFTVVWFLVTPAWMEHKAEG